jgi:hypothetical protein
MCFYAQNFFMLRLKATASEQKNSKLAIEHEFQDCTKLCVIKS